MDQAAVAEETEAQFNRAMAEIYRKAKREAGYTATRFAQMLAEDGGVKTAKTLLHSRNISEGFEALWEANRLDLTVEYQVLLGVFVDLFTEDERVIALNRLLQHGFPEERLPTRPKSRQRRQPPRFMKLSGASNDAARVVELMTPIASEEELVVEPAESATIFRDPTSGRAVLVSHRRGTLSLDLSPFQDQEGGAPTRELLRALSTVAGRRLAVQMTAISLAKVQSAWSALEPLIYRYFSTGVSRDERAAGKVPEEIEEVIRAGEGDRLEFKSSARWNTKIGETGAKDPELEITIVKTVSGFMNGRIGGTLLIGVADDGAIIGIESDYQTLQRRDRDGYENWLTTLFEQRLGKPALAGIAIKVTGVRGKDVCRVDAEASPRPVFVRDHEDRYFFVRFNNSTRRLNAEEMLDYIEDRWPVRP
jgi:hypothetical protein